MCVLDWHRDVCVRARARMRVCCSQSRGDFILVGDLMKSIALLQYSASTGELTELARDYNASWMTSVRSARRLTPTHAAFAVSASIRSASRACWRSHPVPISLSSYFPLSASSCLRP
eukprot:4236683-Pleurochrysis_carterae.AAC.3